MFKTSVSRIKAKDCGCEEELLGWLSCVLDGVRWNGRKKRKYGNDKGGEIVVGMDNCL